MVRHPDDRPIVIHLHRRHVRTQCVHHRGQREVRVHDPVVTDKERETPKPTVLVRATVHEAADLT